MIGRTLTAGALAALALLAPNAGRAQAKVQKDQGTPTFTVQKWNIGGDGGTDYVTAEPGTGRAPHGESGQSAYRPACSCSMLAPSKSPRRSRRGAYPRFGTSAPARWVSF